MEHVVNIKAHLRKVGKVTEMRRFEVNTDRFCCYQVLVNKIEDLFQVFTDKLYYRDSDGDMVLFSTDNELRHAVKLIKDNTLNVHIAPRKDRTVKGNELVLATRKPDWDL